ncbi:MAG: hypothetical protein MPJ50_02615 [Pirellulales bacterium]|nr:hypothetical protein [Pirellulales bacterium]
MPQQLSQRQILFLFRPATTTGGNSAIGAVKVISQATESSTATIGRIRRNVSQTKIQSRRWHTGLTHAMPQDHIPIPVKHWHARIFNFV